MLALYESVPAAATNSSATRAESMKIVFGSLIERKKNLYEV
jgi:hypothetical protein